MKLLLLVTSICLISAYEHNNLDYGSSHRIWVGRMGETLEFLPRDSTTSTILWRRSGAHRSEGSRVRLSGNYLVIDKVTARDSGQYRVKDRNELTHHFEYLDVSIPEQSYTLKTDESLSFTSDLDSKSCNIDFFPENEDSIELIRAGKKSYAFYNEYCKGIDFTRPCDITIEKVQKTCSGRFEIKDDNNDNTMVVYLEVLSSDFNPVYLAIGGFIVAIILISCCATRCCCGKSKSKKTKTQSEPEPAVHYRQPQYDHEPATPRQNQLSEPSSARYAAQPASATTGPLIHSPPVNVPPAYSEVFSPPTTSYTPLCSDAEPRYEPKGMNFNLSSPLSSESPHSNVYTSDKLNFL